MDYAGKATLDEIRARFDKDVERFSNLETGQTATIDAPLAMELITQAAFHATKPIRRILDIGCGAGNNTLKLLALVPDADCDLLDLSEPMRQRAAERVGAATTGRVATIQSDLRTAPLANESYDVILAAAVLHHLRDDADWEMAFKRLYDLLKPGGSVWITDLVSHEAPVIQELMWRRYGEYLAGLGGAEYRDKVFTYIEKEDSPRPVTYQLELLKKAGFAVTDILHKNSCFVAFGAIKGK